MIKYDTIYTAGTFDLFNVGHLNILKKSKELCNRLIVGVSTDKLVESYKKIKPIIPFTQRVDIVRSCKYVDLVVKQEKLLDIDILQKYSVDCVTIGSDWKNKIVPSLCWMKSHGDVVYIPYTAKISSTKIKRKILKNSYNIINAELQRNADR